VGSMSGAPTTNQPEAGPSVEDVLPTEGSGSTDGDPAGGLYPASGDELVETLRVMGSLVDAAQGRVAVQMLSGELFTDAAGKVEQLTEAGDTLAQVLLDNPPGVLPMGAELDDAVTSWESALDLWDAVRSNGRSLSVTASKDTRHQPPGKHGGNNRFNEETLLNDIIDRWGEYGAHAELCRWMIDEIRSLREERQHLRTPVGNTAPDTSGVGAEN